MSVKKEANGRRSIQVEFEVPGTPEEVWQAIASGPGLSSWLVPAEFEERDGKPVALKLNIGPGIETRSELTAWDPPRMYVGQGEVFAGSPPVATEWHVETRSGGICNVRMVHSLFASTDEWDDQLEGAKSGWSGFLPTLRIYLTHFRGLRSAIMQVMIPVAASEVEAWETLTAALGVKGVSVGQRWSTPAGVPPLSGVLEVITENPYDALLRLDTPGPGVAALGAVTYPGGQSMVGMNFYLYGDQAVESVARETPVWQAWFQERFPMPATPSQNAPQRLYLMQVGKMPEYQVPIVCYLVQTGDGKNILIDSGLPETIPAGESEFENGRDVIEQLASIGLKPDDIDTVISTHYDIDHAGRHASFTKAQYVVQRVHHLDAASNPRYAANRPQWDQPMERIRLVDGDTELMPGLELIETSGHVPGNQSVLIRLANTGAILLTVDAVAFGAGFTRDQQGDGSDPDAQAIRASTIKLLDLVERERIGLVIFGHDNQQWETLKKTPEFYA